MTTNHTEPFEQGTVGDLADQAAHAIRLLNHRTRPGAGDLGDPSEVAEVIAALATMASRLPQLLDQLACWLEQERHRDRLRVDDLAPSLDTAQTVNALTGNLGEAIHCLQRTTAELDTAHQHAAHLATNDRGQNSRRSVGPSHLTTLTHGCSKTELSGVPRREQANEGQHDRVYAAALELDQAERDRVGLEPLSRRMPGLTTDEAWDIAAARDRL